MVATLPFSYRIFHKPNKPVPQVDAEKIVQLAQTADPRTNPEVAQFRLEVQEKLANINTVPEAGSISTVICDIAAKHFPKQPQPSSRIVRWQQPHVQEAIKNMWKAWRQYRSSTKDTTLQAILGRWKTWTRYNQLYTKHKERCRTTKKAYALVPRYEVRPCMLALYFLGETSKVFRLVKTSKVFARKHRRCFC